jgi:SAM-dependent methyltransferase
MNFHGAASRVCGVDLDQRVMRNRFLHEARIGSAEAIPYGNAEFDLVFADNVLEHLADPESAFVEIARVLKPGGRFLAKTPNKWHYVPLIASVTPHRFHHYYNRLRGRASADTFPTHYLANSTARISRLARAAQLEIVEVSHVEGRPEYLRMSPVTYAFGRMYERFVNSSSRLASLRVLLMIELRKPNTTASHSVG